MKTSEVLNKAADLIQQRGWVGSGYDDGADPWGLDGASPVCVEGGIMAASGDAKYSGLLLLATCPAATAVHAYLQLSADTSLWMWNDRPTRTAEEVIEVLRAAAVIEQSREEAVEKVSV